MNLPDSTVFVVDDDPSVRDALTSLMASEGLRSVAFATGAELLGHDFGPEPACLVLDMQLAGMRGLDLYRLLAEAGQGMPVVYITGHGDIPTSVSAMKAGAVDVLTKPFQPEELLAAVHRALECGAKARESRARDDALVRKFRALTAREREVMALVVRGLLNKQIAATLGIAEITTKVHRRRVMQKMKARTLPELVRMVDALSRAYTHA